MTINTISGNSIRQVQVLAELDLKTEYNPLTGSTIKDLLQFTGTWEGDDFEECLQGVYDTRLSAEF